MAEKLLFMDTHSLTFAGVKVPLIITGNDETIFDNTTFNKHPTIVDGKETIVYTHNHKEAGAGQKVQARASADDIEILLQLKNLEKSTATLLNYDKNLVYTFEGAKIIGALKGNSGGDQIYVELEIWADRVKLAKV